VGAAAVAGLDEAVDVGLHEGLGHRHLAPVGQHEIRTFPELRTQHKQISDFFKKITKTQLSNILLIINQCGGEGYLLDEGEDVVPSAAVETGRVIPQLVQDLAMQAKVVNIHTRTHRTHLARECRTSSIWKAARMVSMRTVALTLPRERPMRSCEKLKTSFHRRASW
jgi:hypothetical protein